MSQTVVTSLAILNVNWNRKRDYIENFVPFVSDCLRAASQDEVSLQQLQADVVARFGLRIPLSALRTILGRAQQRGYVRPEHGIYRRNADALANQNLSSLLGKYRSF